MPEERAVEVLSVVASISRSPFPSPDMLGGYDKYQPGFGREIVEWIKDQTRHRQGLETRRADGSERRLNRSQINALLIAFAGIGVAAFLASINTLVAIAVVLVCVGGPAGATIVARMLDRPKGKDDE